MRTRSINGRVAKHVPQRTCVACRQTDGKRGLVRLVRTPAGSVEVDVTGKKAGRGAYLCRAARCWETGINEGKVEHSLKVRLSQDDKSELIKAGHELLKENLVG